MKAYLKHLPLVAALLALGAVFSLQNENFASRTNLENILEQITVNSLLAFGMTFVILLGGIDLSVGSTMAFAGLTAVYLLQATGQFFIAVSGGLGAGLAVGLVND